MILIRRVLPMLLSSENECRLYELGALVSRGF
jgi:hypothetical protein